MPVTYTNRKGITYYLCQGTTKTGKPRYYFARQPKGEFVAEIPAGFKISESVNGRVSLVKDRAMQLFPEEIAAVEAAVRRHPRARNYRVSVKHDCMEIYEQVGPDADDLIAASARQGLRNPDLADRNVLNKSATPSSRRCCASFWPTPNVAPSAPGVHLTSMTTGLTWAKWGR